MIFPAEEASLSPSIGIITCTVVAIPATVVLVGDIMVTVGPILSKFFAHKLVTAAEPM